MPISAPPTLQHAYDSVNKYIKWLLSETLTIKDRACLILMAGIALNNKSLMEYACNIDPGVVNKEVPSRVLTTTDAIMFPAIGVKLSANLY